MPLFVHLEPTKCQWCGSEKLEERSAKDSFLVGKIKYKVRLDYKFCLKCKGTARREMTCAMISWERVKK